MGDIKIVSDGYGRNYLLPNKFAKHADAGALKEVEALKKKFVINASFKSSARASLKYK